MAAEYVAEDGGAGHRDEANLVVTSMNRPKNIYLPYLFTCEIR